MEKERKRLKKIEKTRLHKLAETARITLMTPEEKKTEAAAKKLEKNNKTSAKKLAESIKIQQAQTLLAAAQNTPLPLSC